MKKIMVLLIMTALASCNGNKTINTGKEDTKIQKIDTVNKVKYYNTSQSVFNKDIFGIKIGMSLSDIKNVIKADNVTYCLYEDRNISEDITQAHFCIDKFYVRDNGSNDKFGRLSASCILSNDSLKVFHVNYTGCGDSDYNYKVIIDNLINEIGDCYISIYEDNELKSISWEYKNASILFSEDELGCKFIEISDNNFFVNIDKAIKAYSDSVNQTSPQYERDDVGCYKKNYSKYDYIKANVSSGYVKGFKPTKSPKGEYHTIDGRAKQIQYQGSAEQQRDLDAIDEYARTHPGF